MIPYYASLNNCNPMKTTFLPRRRAGFTLIELLVVVAIIASLAVIPLNP